MDATGVASHSPRVPQNPKLNFALLAVAVAALIPRVYLGLTQFVAYDGYGHVFIATQDRWANMVLEYKSDAHPILYYILLRWVALLGHLQIVYRTISILPGAAAVFLIGRIAEKVCANKVVPVLAAAAYAFAITSIDLSIDVRSYMGCLFFVLLSFYFFLKTLPLADDALSARSWVLFALFASLAISFEYYAIFYLAGCIGILTLLIVFDGPYRAQLRAWAPSRLPSLAAAALIPVLTILYFYRSHISRLPRNFGHLNSFYWDPASGESRFEFVLTNWQKAFAYFLPVQVPNRTAFLAIVASLLLVLIAFSLTQRDRLQRLCYRATLLMPVLLLLQLAFLGLARRYPFGGEMRQQSILAPFLCLNLFMLLDQLISIPLSSHLRSVASAAIAIAIAGSAYFQWSAYPKVTQELFSDDYQQFLAVTGPPETIYLDQYSLTAYYIHTHDWTWRSAQRQNVNEPIEEFRTEHGSQSVDILRDRSAWNFDFTSPSTYEAVAQLMRNYHKPSITVFHLQQIGPTLPPGSQQQHFELVQSLARESGLKASAFYTDGTDFFATFISK